MLIKTLFDQAQLAEAAYAKFSNITDEDEIKNNLITLGFSKKQTDKFTEHWEVISHQPNLYSGFSATLFKNKHSGELVFANRGTETTFPELVSDVIVFGVRSLICDYISAKIIFKFYDKD